MESEITLDDLDIDLLKLISYQLDPKDCFHLSLSCKKCSELITNVYYWHEKLGYLPEDSLKSLEEYQTDYVAIHQFNPDKTNAGNKLFEIQKKSKKQVLSRRHRKVAVGLLHFVLNISWDYIVFFCDSLFLITLMLQLDRLMNTSSAIPSIFFFVSVMVRTVFPYIAMFCLKYLYGSFFDKSYLPRVNVSVFVMGCVHLYSSPYSGVLSFISIFLIITYVLFVLFITGYIGFAFVLTPILICAIITTFSCGNFTCLPFYRKFKSSCAKPFYLSFPSICMIISICFLISRSIVDFDVIYPVIYMMIPIFVAFVYLFVILIFTMIYLNLCQYRLIIDDIPFSHILFPCWQRKTISEAKSLYTKIFIFSIFFFVPIVISVILLTLKLDGYIDITYSGAMCPLLFIFVFVAICGSILQTSCCVSESMKDPVYNELNHLEENSSNGNSNLPFDVEYEMDVLPNKPQVTKGKALNLPNKNQS